MEWWKGNRQIGYYRRAGPVGQQNPHGRWSLNSAADETHQQLCRNRQ